MSNIKKLNQHAGKRDEQQNLKDVLDAAMVSTPEEVTYDSPTFPMKSTPVKETSSSKSLCLFNDISDVKKKSSKRCVAPAESKHRAMKVGNILWIKKKKMKRAFKNK